MDNCQVATSMDSLCDYCAALFPIRPERGAHRITHHANVAELIRSAQYCRLCSAIRSYWSLNDLMHQFPEVTEQRFASLPLSFRVQDPGNFSWGMTWALLVGVIKVPFKTHMDHFSLSITTCEPESDAEVNPLWQGRDSSIEEKYATIESWYSDCVANHSDCIPPGTRYPTRLIEVGEGDSPPRLIHTSDGVKEKAPYATLSHCWGNYRPLTTVKDNLDALTREIPVASLPRTFCDAIAITKQLGIPYIWIDSLCIIQDDDDDWCMEAMLMKNTYSCSAITIGASDARNSLQGCFIDSRFDIADPRRYRVIQFMVHPVDTGSLFQVRVHGGDIRSRVSGTKLSTRGWNLQEQVLSHRVIHCMRPEIHWQCRLKYRVESGVAFSGTDYMRSWTHALPSVASPEELHILWCTWMEDYSQRHFTFEKDRTGALAGIIHKYSDRSGHNHVLACWEETMIEDLMWMRVGHIVDPAMFLPEIPSWSWISRCSHVSFNSWCRWIPKQRIQHTEDHLKILHVSVAWKGQHMVSEVEDTKLVIEGPVKQLRLRVDLRNPVANPAYINVNNEDLDFSKNPVPWRCSGQFDLEHEREDDKFTCLLMRTTTANDGGEFSFLQETFLILLPIPDAPSHDTYMRVGIATTRGTTAEFDVTERKCLQLV